MKVTYTSGKEVKKFTPITLHITIETEEELAALYTRHNIILDKDYVDLIENNKPRDFTRELHEETPTALWDTIEYLWDDWKK